VSNYVHETLQTNIDKARWRLITAIRTGDDLELEQAMNRLKLLTSMVGSYNKDGKLSA
jgi:hypothetical protein